MRRAGRLSSLAALVSSTIVLSATAASGADPSYLNSGRAWKEHPNIAPSGDTFEVFTTPGGYGALAEAPTGIEVYRSRNATRWNPVPRASAAFAGEVDLNESATGNGLIVVVGSTGPEEERTPTFWLSKNGTRWTKHVGSASAFGAAGSTFVNDVTRGKGQWVAVGGDLSSDVLFPAIWTSKDAKSWTRVAPGEELQTTDTTFLRGVASSGSRYVAVGSERDTAPGASTFGEVPVAYSSKNGKSWTRASNVATPGAVATTNAPNPSTIRRVVANGVAHAAGKFVIYGSGTDALSEGSFARAPFVVTTKNGAGGKGVVLPGPPSSIGELWTITDVAGRGNTLVAVGYRSRPPTDAGAAIWVSKNAGGKWKLLRGREFELPAGRTFGGPTYVSVTKTGVLTTGVATGDGPSRPIAWVGGRP